MELQLDALFNWNGYVIRGKKLRAILLNIVKLIKSYEYDDIWKFLS